MTSAVVLPSVHPPYCPLCTPKSRCSVRFTKHGYTIYRCGECNLLFVHPQPSPEDIIALYGPAYFERGNKYSFDPENGELNPDRHNNLVRISVLQQYKPSGRLLDVGCAEGGFLEVAREMGFNVSGIEVSDYAATYARGKLGIDVANSNLAEARLPSESYDVVTMWDVIEHLSDPCQTLREIHRILRRGGLLALSTGNAGSLWARLAGRFWQLLTPPQHLFFFDEKNLGKALGLSGFAVKEMLYVGKRTTLDFILFKARETLGPVVSPVQAIITCLGLNKGLVTVNLYDIVTCVAEKK